MNRKTPFALGTAVLLLGLVLIFHRVGLASQVPDDWDSLEVAGILEYLCRRPTGTVELNYYPTGYPLLLYAQAGAVGVLLPFCRLIPAPLLLNLSHMGSHAVAFFGTLKLAAGLGVGPLPALLAALGYTFSAFRVRSEGHYHMLFGSAVLPWAVYFTLRCARAEKAGRGPWLGAGAAWALTVLFHPYFGWVWVITWAALAWACRRALRPLGAGLAVTLALVGPYGAAVAAVLGGGFWQPVGGLAYTFQSGVSPDFLVLPSPFNLLVGRAVSRAVDYQSPPNLEGKLGTLGLTVWVLLALGLVRFRVLGGPFRPLLGAAAVFLALALGPVAMVGGRVADVGLFRPVNQALWGLGEALKPAVFTTEPPEWVLRGLPLPAFVWVAAVPLGEGVRAMARLIIPAGLVFNLAAARVLGEVPRRLGLVLGLVWLAELLPGPVGWTALPEVHPVYDWLAARRDQGAALVVGGHGPVTRAPHLWSALVRDVPTANGYASYQPAYYEALWRGLAESDAAFDDTVGVLYGLNVRFLVVEVGDDVDRLMYARAGRSPNLRFVRCFEPAAPGRWFLPACVFELQPPAEAARQFDLLFDRGWWIREGWGRWAVDREASAFFWRTGPAPRLDLEAFPNCVPGETQTLSLSLNGRPVLTEAFDDCRPARVSVRLPAEALTGGWNRLSFKFGYARPAPGSPVPLAAGLTKARLPE